MTPEDLEDIRLDMANMSTGHEAWEPYAWDLLAYIDALHAEIAALRRGQVSAPAPAQAGPVPVALHETHPIPKSREER